MLQGLLAVGALAAFVALPVSAQTPYASVAKGTEALIRAYDQKVRDVDSLIPATPGSATECGNVGDGDLTAFYCAQSRSIYITDKALQAVGNTFGQEGVSLMVAHEYAHARQHAVQGFTSSIIWSSVIDEIQADCVAGVYMNAARPMPISNQTLHKTAGMLYNMGDYMPLDRNWHGTPQMRTESFLHGYRSGMLSSCLASDDANISRLMQKSSDAIQDQVKNSQSELNLLLRWGNNILRR